MDLTRTDVTRLRAAVSEGLPAIDQAGAAVEQGPAMTYVPPAHAQALDADRCIVEGIRGAGKSFWWAALNSEPHRRHIARAFPDAHLSDAIIVKQGFGAASGSLDAPSQDVLAALLAKRFTPRTIWRAVVARQLDFQKPFPRIGARGIEPWEARTAWVRDNPESFDEMLMACDRGLSERTQRILILFDALDRLAETWQEIRPLAKGLFQVTQDLRSTRNIRLKLFVRPDMLEDKMITGFPDASKLLGRRASLTWRKVDLYALFFQCAGNASTGGTVFRKLSGDILGNRRWSQTDGIWTLPADLRSDEKVQEKVFEAIAGTVMSASPTGLKRGKPYKWVVNHLQDGRDQVSPRSFCEALRLAAQRSRDDFEDSDLPLHYKALQAGVQAASRVRVDELVNEDYPWIQLVMDPLHGNLSVPCPPQDIMNLWLQGGVIDSLTEHLNSGGAAVKLPPQHLDEREEGVLRDLTELGLMQTLSDGRIQMPDVYRIAFGLGRRGGVKPLK